MLAHADEVSGAKRRELLNEHRELALLSKKLASLEHDAPIDIDAAEVLPHEPQREKLEELFARFEFTSLMDARRAAAARCGDGGGAPRPQGAARAARRRRRRGRARGSAQAATLAPARRGAGRRRGAGDGSLDWAAPVGLAVDDEAAVAGAGRRRRRRSTAGLRGVHHGQGGGAARRPPARCAALLGTGQRGLPRLQVRPGAARAAGQGGARHLSGRLSACPGAARLPAGGAGAGGGDAVPPCGAGGTGGGARRGAVAGGRGALLLAGRQERGPARAGHVGPLRDIELPLTRVLIAMERAGIHLDCYRLGEITGKIQDQMEELEASIYELAGEQFNLGSPQQLGRILFERLGLARQRKTKTGYSTDAKTLEALRDSHPIVEHLLSHRELSKLMSTYLLALPQVVDPEHRPAAHHLQPDGGRHRAALVERPQPAEHPRPHRRWARRSASASRAEPGHVLVVADYSQIELRIMAHLSGEAALLESFARGRGHPHAARRPRCSACPKTRWTPTHRRYAKAVNFGIMYGISAFGLSQNLGIEREEAAAYIERYFERLPRVKAFIEETIDLARRQGYVATVFGRRRPIPELSSGNFQERSLGERLAVNSVIQGSAADIIKVAMIRCHERLEAGLPGGPPGAAGARRTGVRGARGAWREAVRDAVVEEMAAAFPWSRRWGWMPGWVRTGCRPSSRRR